MKRRLRKRWHRRVLERRVIDLSTVSFWRARLFSAPLGQEFPLDAEHLEGVPDALARDVRRHRLRYQAARVLPEEAEPWLSEGGLVIFRFRAREFPAVAVYSGNNPDVL